MIETRSRTENGYIEFACCASVECAASEIPDYAVQKQTKDQGCTKMLSRDGAVS